MNRKEQTRKLAELLLSNGVSFEETEEHLNAAAKLCLRLGIEGLWDLDMCVPCKRLMRRSRERNN